MTVCRVKMPPEGKEVLVKIGYRYAVAYWLNVGDKPHWLPGAATVSRAERPCDLVGEPTEWFYLPPSRQEAAMPSSARQFGDQEVQMISHIG